MLEAIQQVISSFPKEHFKVFPRIEEKNFLVFKK
ncbi:hypothetical protein FUSO4_02555 [Fusobacterium necrophorum DJ-1]|uniref:Uncharacterized protein n=2 Tax=Fusobacterium necrophorum TaxID=859 RepID=A0AB73BVJ5_9FUSO|nr:hypothetical protein FUSO5_12215 [Fusobacterium necrophorum BFTR-1]KDE62718.1 hypothetical protein FUSO3_07120 [Fusobacterium necrophorum BL]KDE67654.1 hypothetical protein FUSO4_02555 [Fusobacterium necrophorum DJ-1]KDE71780.1 hypothetical protein FUSO8_07555 [Fusobacterium necrophorum DJ-2]KDE74305.1 hypothetical protein FUSO7_03505 [Fusobacterium necrophorum BFTR-2]